MTSGSAQSRAFDSYDFEHHRAEEFQFVARRYTGSPIRVSAFADGAPVSALISLAIIMLALPDRISLVPRFPAHIAPQRTPRARASAPLERALGLVESPAAVRPWTSAPGASRRWRTVSTSRRMGPPAARVREAGLLPSPATRLWRGSYAEIQGDHSPSA